MSSSKTLKPNEFRIGNIIQCQNPFEGSLQRATVFNILPTDLMVFDNEQRRFSVAIDAVKPIRLSPEILERCGFVIADPIDDLWLLLIYPDIKTYLSLNATTGVTALFEHLGEASHYTAILSNNKHLHQLQNLYFSLSGNELEIK